MPKEPSNNPRVPCDLAARVVETAAARGTRKAAEEHNLPLKRVQYLCRRAGVTAHLDGKPKGYVPPDVLQAALNDTLNGVSCREAARRHGIHLSAVWSARRRAGVTKPGKGARQSRQLEADLALLEAAAGKHCPREPWTQAEIGRALGVSHQAIDQIAGRAMRRIRMKINDEFKSELHAYVR